jgi:hypothetical protein
METVAREQDPNHAVHRTKEGLPIQLHRPEADIPLQDQITRNLSLGPVPDLEILMQHIEEREDVLDQDQWIQELQIMKESRQ